MEQITEEGIDFQLFSVSHHCHKADKYLSRFSTCDSRPCSKTPLEDETVSDLSAYGEGCCGSFSMGTLVLLSHLKALVQLFMPFLKIAKLALNFTSFLVCWQYGGLRMSVSSQ